VHIEPGWENALEAALRERLGALSVGRLETVRAFEQDAPPAKLAFYSPPARGGHPPAGTAGLPRWPTCCGGRRGPARPC
jgi:chromosome segregation protein